MQPRFFFTPLGMGARKKREGEGVRNVSASSDDQTLAVKSVHC